MKTKTRRQNKHNRKNLKHSQQQQNINKSQTQIKKETELKQNIKFNTRKNTTNVNQRTKWLVFYLAFASVSLGVFYVSFTFCALCFVSFDNVLLCFRFYLCSCFFSVLFIVVGSWFHLFFSCLVFFDYSVCSLVCLCLCFVSLDYLVCSFVWICVCVCVMFCYRDFVLFLFVSFLCWLPFFVFVFVSYFAFLFWECFCVFDCFVCSFV